MKILHVSHTDIRSDSRILKEMSSLSEFYTDKKVVGIGFKPLKDERVLDNVNNLEIITHTLISLGFRIPKLRALIIYLEMSLKLLFSSISQKPDILHCHDVTVLPAACLIKIVTGAKLIYDAHELESDKNGLSNFDKKLIYFTEKTLWLFIDHLIVVSPSIGIWYTRKISDKPYTVIFNSPQPHTISDLPSNYLRDKFSIPKDTLIFIYVGILNKGRGIELLLDVFKNTNHNVAVVFLGYGALFEELVAFSNSFNNIFVHEAVQHDKVVAVAKTADVGLCLIENVSLSDYYCLPNKLFEYSFSELPILSSKFPDLECIVNRYNLGVCCDLNKSSIENAINQLTLPNSLPVINSNNLYDLTWDAQADKLKHTYDTYV